MSLHNFMSFPSLIRLRIRQKLDVKFLFSATVIKIPEKTRKHAKPFILGQAKYEHGDALLRFHDVCTKQQCLILGHVCNP